MSAVYGVLCRLLWYSSLAYDTKTDVVVELATPRITAPNGILLCFTDSSFSQNSSVVVQSLKQGGDVWQAHTERELLQQDIDWAASTFFKRDATQVLRPLEVVDVGTALGSDPYYAGSYTFRRYDDVVADQHGTPFPTQLLQSLASAAAATAHASNSSSTASQAEPQQARGQCLVVTGKWQPNTRYQLTLTVQHPPEPTPSPSTPVKPPDMWMAPLTYQVKYNSSGQPDGVSMHVRGSKHGQLCSLRPQAAAVSPRMFSACGEAAARGLVAANATSTTADCLAALQLALSANNATLGNTFPFNVPPLARLGPDSTPDAACPAGSVLSSNFGGECIDCTHANIEGSRCSCLPGYITHLMGPAACGPRITSSGSANDAAALAAQLCNAYSGYYDKMMQGELADRLVHSMYMSAFRRQAAYLLDWTAIQQGNATFWRDLVIDERMPSSPSRRAGVGPNCTACRHGTFTDIYTKQQVAVRDDRFLAVNMFRLFGYLLSTAGYPCTALWDPADPLKKMYGRYDKAMCMN